MKLDLNANVFDESTLKNVLTCALLMSSIDGEVHSDEWNVIQRFVDHHWKGEFGDFASFKKSMEREIEAVFSETKEFQTKLDKLIVKLTNNLSSTHKNMLLNLVGDVMIADGIMTLEESKLFANFMEKLGIRIS